MANVKPLKLGTTGAETMSATDTANFPGGVSVGTSSAPTAWLMAGAGTTTVAPLLLTSGTNLTSVANGAIEFDGTDLFFSAGGVRYTLRKTVGPAVVTGRATGQTAAVATVATLTVGAADASYMVSGNILVTTSSAENFSMSVDWTDEGNTARSTAIPLIRIATGGFTANTSSGFGAVPYPSIELQIRCKASTSITIKTNGTFTGATYNVEASIRIV